MAVSQYLTLERQRFAFLLLISAMIAVMFDAKSMVIFFCIGAMVATVSSIMHSLIVISGADRDDH